MSKYTTELRFICETLAGNSTAHGYGDVSNIISKSWEKIFDFDFPIFDEAYRSVLCQKILMHYYTREIGFETVGLWKLKLATKMQEIMPYFNKLYLSETYQFNPLHDTDITTTYEGSDAGEGEDTTRHTGTVGDIGTHTGTVRDENDHTGTVDVTNAHDGTVTDDSSHTGTVTDAGTHGGTITDEYEKDRTHEDDTQKTTSDTEWNVFSDTPQGALTNVANETYLTDARKITRNGSETVHNEGGDTDDGSNTRTFNETNGNTRTYNERTVNEREYDEDITNTTEYDESVDNLRTYNEGTRNDRTYNETNDTDRQFSNTKEYTEHIVGKRGGAGYAGMIMEYRKSLMNIDMMVIDSLNSLFMLVW